MIDMAYIRAMLKRKAFNPLFHHRIECVAGLFMLLVSFTFLFILWSNANLQLYKDGRVIDLSAAHQRDLIEEYRKNKLKGRNIQTGYSDEKNEYKHNIKRNTNYPHSAENLDSYMEMGNSFGDTVNGDKKMSNILTYGTTESSFIYWWKTQRHKLPRSEFKNDADVAELFHTNTKTGPYMETIIKDNSCILYDLTATEEVDTYECMNLTLTPTTTVCLNAESDDIFVTKYLKRQGVWEPHIVKEFQNILYGNPELAVIDVGAHIGQYSLIAASMGHHVVSVEPYIENLKRLRAGAQKGGVHDKIVAVKNAVSDHRSVEYLHVQPDNRGGVSIGGPNRPKDCLPEETILGRTAVRTHPAVMCDDLIVRTILMDDLLNVINFTKAIIKIDIEGYEHRAFHHADHLLDVIQVPYIFMEWVKLREYFGAEITQSEDKDLVFSLIEKLTQRGYVPYSLASGDKPRLDMWYAWGHDVIWKHRSQY